MTVVQYLYSAVQLYSICTVQYSCTVFVQYSTVVQYLYSAVLLYSRACHHWAIWRMKNPIYDFMLPFYTIK